MLTLLIIFFLYDTSYLFYLRKITKKKDVKTNTLLTMKDENVIKKNKYSTYAVDSCIFRCTYNNKIELFTKIHVKIC